MMYFKLLALCPALNLLSATLAMLAGSAILLWFCARHEGTVASTLLYLAYVGAILMAHARFVLGG